MSDEKKKKPPRKISCLPCRTKKAKCDGGIPYCNRCIRNSRENKCIYPKPRTFGRPPKNAVFHKSQDTIMNTETNKNDELITVLSSANSSNLVACREFIFENQCNIEKPNNSPSVQEQQEKQHQLILSKSKNSPHLMKFTAQILDIERIFSLYISRGSALREKLLDFKLNPPFKTKTLHQHFTWITSSLINITIKRSCQMIELESFYDPELTIAAFMKEEDINVFFFNMNIQDNKTRNTESSTNPEDRAITNNQCSTTSARSSSSNSSSSPLNSIPTDQAIQLIDYFFQLHPYCIVLNKTKVLDGYWNDTIEPLLLSVIYGITIYTCQQALKGKPFVLRVINRNPFLNYAYVLLEKFFLQRDQYQNASSVSSPSSLGTYQATVILGIFETLYGFSKHGMTIISLSYMMASDLGVFQNDSSTTKEQTEKVLNMDPIDREQLVNTYWAALRSTAYGCIEMGLYLRESLLFHGQPFPPANIDTSASYQYDLLHNNHTSSSSYLIESFHTEMVITYFSSKLFACLPKTEYNLFGCPTTPPNPPSIGELLQQQYNVLLQLLDAAAAASSQYDTMVNYQVERVLNDFEIFIQQERYQWSPFQLYMIESTHLLYCIHFKFMRSQNDIAPTRYHKVVPELNLANTSTASRIAKLLPKTYLLIQKLQTFLFENMDIEDSDERRISLLPLGLMMVTLETTIQLMTFHYQLDPQNKEVLDQLVNLYFISRNSIWNHCGPVAKSIQKKFKEFLKFHQIPYLASQQRADDQQVSSRGHTDTEITNHDVVALVQPPEIFLKEKSDKVNREEAIPTPVPMPTTSIGAGDVSFLFLEGHPTSPSTTTTTTFPSSSPSSECFQTIDSSFLKEFDDIFKQAIDVNVSP